MGWLTRVGLLMMQRRNVSGIASQATGGAARTDLGPTDGLAPDTKRGDSKPGKWM